MMQSIRNFFSRALSISGGSLRDPRLNEIFGSSSVADAGVSVTPWTALNYSAVFAAVRIISEAVSSLPLHLYERLPNGGKRRASGTPLYSLVHDAPNDEMGSLQWREASMAHLLLWGNSYSEIVRDLEGNAVELWPLDPSQVKPTRTANGELFYDVGGKVALPRENVLHVSGLSFDGISGISPIAQARQSIGLALAIEQFGAGFFGRGARPGGILTFPGQLSSEARANLRRSFEDLHSGSGNSHRVALLEQGLKWESIGVPPDDSQFLQSREFQVIEICRWFNLPPHKLKELAKMNYNSLEQMNVEFLTDTLRPWLVRWEQQLNRKLLRKQDRERFLFEHAVEGILRGDLQSRYTSYSIARNWGWLSVNEIREKETLNPVEGGDTYLTPQNMAPANGPSPDPAAAQSAQQVTNAQDPTLIRSDLSAEKEQAILIRLLEDAGNRLQSIECNAVKRFANKPSEFLEKIGKFCEEHRTRVVSAYAPVLEAFSRQHELEEHVQRHLDVFSKLWVEFSGTVTASKLSEEVEKKINSIRGNNHDQ
jgi:HK97 family phage portal protein